MVRVRLFALIAFVAMHCGGTPTSPSTPPPGEAPSTTTSGGGSVLTTPPPVEPVVPVVLSCTLTTPAKGSTVSATVTLAATAAGAARVELDLDDVSLGEVTTAPYLLAWDTTTASDGAHVLVAKAFSASGFEADSTQVAVTVDNGVSSGGGVGTGGGVAGTHGAAVSVHTTLGIPDSASADITNADHYLSVKPQYVISYNSSRKEPNWASWELNAGYLGTMPRSNDFRADGTLPAILPQATLADYAGSSYERGHMCPSADRNGTLADNQATFFLTNMLPQAANNNDGPWGKLEAYERTLAQSGKELFIVSGGVPGTTTIGNGVAVPSATFKVIVVLDAAGDGVSAVNENTRLIAVEMPNDDSKISSAAAWSSFIVTARQIETDTGLDFDADVPQGIQDVIENRRDYGN